MARARNIERSYKFCYLGSIFTRWEDPGEGGRRHDDQAVGYCFSSRTATFDTGYTPRGTSVLSPDAKTLATWSEDKTIVKLWDVGTQRELVTLKGHEGFVSAVAFSPDGRTLATGGGNRSIKFWDVGRPQDPTVLKGHQGTLHSVTISPDGEPWPQRAGITR